MRKNKSHNKNKLEAIDVYISNCHFEEFRDPEYSEIKIHQAIDLSSSRNTDYKYLRLLETFDPRFEADEYDVGNCSLEFLLMEEPRKTNRFSGPSFIEKRRPFFE